MDDFSEHPRSVAEVRSDRSGDAADWTPRDCLIDLLRAIDQGEKVESMIICWTVRDEAGKQRARYRQATPNALITLGLLSRTAGEMMK